MKKWKEFQKKIVLIVDGLNNMRVQFKPYAQTYARNIVASIDDGKEYGYSATESIKTQLLYVLANLDGATEEELKRIQTLALENDIDLTETINEMIGKNYDC